MNSKNPNRGELCRLPRLTTDDSELNDEEFWGSFLVPFFLSIHKRTENRLDKIYNLYTENNAAAKNDRKTAFFDINEAP